MISPFSHVLRKWPRVARGRVRSIVLDTVCRWTRVEQRWRSLRETPRVEILLLHDLKDADLDRFRALLSVLQEKFAFLKYSDAVDHVVSGRIDRPYLAFSFDDGLRSCRNGAAVLEEFGARGMFFVCPGIVDADSTQQAMICRDRLWIEPCEFLDWADITELHQRGHEFGSHTMSHVNVADIRPADVANEVAMSKNQIVDRLGECGHFAWPYGRLNHFSPKAREIVLQLRFQSCASGERGSHAAHRETRAWMPCLHRQSIDVRWPLAHIKHFLERGSHTPLLPSDNWPAGWGGADGNLERAA